MRFLMLAAVCLLFVSCATTEPAKTGSFKGPFRGSYLSRISVGMPKAEVVQQIGEPYTVAGNNVGELFTYRDNQKGRQQYDFYFVRFVDGKVESYGPQNMDHPIAATPEKH